ncbi:MAG: WYL domain-containing protein [Coriobacteriia bacterium]|jgi:proteasome accessory factor B|nr:WYL domain-containing protein [Coriobacteriia bacterium]
MAEAVERLVNLAMFLAAANSPVSVERIRAEVAGYPNDQDEVAFIRMFERDKDDLRAMGISIESTPEGTYHVDAQRTFAAELDLSPEEEVVLRATAAVFVSDPTFPFARDLRYALAKVSGPASRELPATGRFANEESEGQGTGVGVFAAAITARKQVTFDYTNAAGVSHFRRIEPYGLFVHSGRWYAVGRDMALGEIRVYALARIEHLKSNAVRPKAPDFDRPADFDVATYIGLPFQYGTGEPFEAQVRFSPAAAWRAKTLTGGLGELREDAEGLVWHVSARDCTRLARWTLTNGPGISVIAPSEAVTAVETGIQRVAVLHG